MSALPRLSLSLCLAGALLCLVRAAPAQEPLEARLRARAAALGPRVEWSLLVADVSGEVLAAHEAERALIPASNMKLLTTLAALELLGPDFAHETRVLVAAAPVEGVVQGDLFVVGGGDPTISRRFDPSPLLSDWAAALWDKGLRRIGGDVVIDDRCFEAQRFHPAWEASDGEEWYGAEIGGLTLNDGCLDVIVSGGAEGPKVQLEPPTAYLTLDLQARPTGAKKEHSFALTRTGPDKRTLRVSGKVWTRAGGYEASVPVPDPGLYFACVLREALVRQGIAVDGAARRVREGETPAGLTVWQRRAPLPRTLEVTNQRSQNLYAESLLKTLGQVRRGEGSWKAGAAELQAFARSAGVAEGQVVVSDGSGLSRENRLSARALVTVLQRALRGPHAELYLGTLAVPGEEGTLRSRLRDLGQGVTLHGKTGTMTGIHGLSGVLVKGERRVVFSFLGNGPGAVRQALDEMVKETARTLR